MFSSLRPSRLTPLLGACLFASAPLHADVLQFSDSHPLSLTNWNDTLSIPKFDPALGTLQSVQLTFEGLLAGDASIENFAASRSVVTTTLSAEIQLQNRDTSVLVQLNPQVANVAALTAFDGTIDFAGTSGVAYLGLSQMQSQAFTYLPANAAFNQFVGPGTLNFPASAVGNSVATGSGNIVSQFNSSAEAVLTVIYTFQGITDCNNNGVDDATDIGSGTSQDCDANGVPDECQPDCGTNGIPDVCEGDDDNDGVPNDCDIPAEPCDEIGRRTAGSLLLYPEFDNRQNQLTLVTVTNTNCDFTPVGLQFYAGTIDVEFVYIGRYGINGQDLPCLEFNRTHRLTPCDTLTVWTSAHNFSQQRGFLYVFAKSPQTGRAVVFNHLIGQEIIMDGIGSGMDDSVNAVPFLGVGAEGTPTDVDGDNIRDLDGVEYSKAPDEILIPRFLGQDDPFILNGDNNAVGLSLFNSRLILIALSGGTSFTTTLDFLIYNDNEEEFSDEYTFYCWDSPLLADISGSFLESFLDSTTNDPNEILGANGREAGWFRIDGDIASSSAAEIQDPAFYAVLVERIGQYAVAALPFELCTQSNGDLLPRGPFGDQ